MAHSSPVATADALPQRQFKYEVGVRVLCEFTAKRGDLDRRFAPSPSAHEGVAGHRIIGARRAPGYEREVSLASEYGPLRVRGRADGYDPHAHQLEEFKTYRGSFDRIAANHRALHWAQLRIYGWLLCCARGYRSIRLALVYFDIATAQETVLAADHSAPALQEHFTFHCQRFVEWAESEAAHRRARDAALAALHFPHAAMHAGQRQLAEAVYRSARGGRRLLAQAPTGSGKTLGSLFPALKAMPGARLDKLFYLVAKSSGRRVALDALRSCGASGTPAPLRVLELVARSKACEYPGHACDGDGCALARGFYDRLPAARAAAMTLAILDQRTVRELALRHAICPYYLGQELARWSDVIVADYNYYFDYNAALYSWVLAERWRVCVHVDEAHNLIERARQMFSVALERCAFDEACLAAPAQLASAFARVRGAWEDLAAAQEEHYRVYGSLPPALLAALQGLIAAVSEHWSAAPPRHPDAVQEFFFDAVRFCGLAEAFDSATLFEITLRGSAAEGRASAQQALCLRNVLPRRFLAPRFAAAQAAVLFSATLAPQHFYRDMLGLDNQTDLLEVAAPFDPEQLAVNLVPWISTRYRDRQRSLEPIADLIAEQYRQQPGNYLAYFPSFQYLNAVAACTASRHPNIALWRQAPQMSEPEREAFLAQFSADGCGIGFAVLGGAFAEGIDLPGSRLRGAFIATLGLPPVSAVNAEVERRLGAAFGCGYEYTYLFPGIRKVIQAAGRVIRAPQDRGVLFLIDDRFCQAQVRRLLPPWWRVNDAVSRADSSSR